MPLIQHIKQKPIARKTLILVAAMTLGIAMGTNALAAGHGGGGGGHGGGGGFGGGHIGGGFSGGGHAGGGFGGAHIAGGFGTGHIAGEFSGGRTGGAAEGFAGAHVGSLGGAQFHGPRPGGGFHDGHHRLGGSLRGGTFGYVPSYDDYGYADLGDYADDGACFQYRHVHTTTGWRWRQVWVCD